MAAPAAAPVIVSSTTTTTRKSARNKVAPGDEGEDGKNLDTDDSDVEVEWFWAGDSKTGQQDVRILYSAVMGQQIESSHATKQKVMKVDDERYIDFKEMTQRRYDDKNKRRALYRVKKRVLKAAKPPLAPAPVVVAAAAPPARAPAPVEAPVALSAPPPVIISAPAAVPTPAPTPASSTAPVPAKADDDGSCTDSDTDSKIGAKRMTRSKSASQTLPVAKKTKGKAKAGNDSDGSCTEDESDTAKKQAAPAAVAAVPAAGADDGDEISWFWAADSKGGHQDMWVQYEATMAKKLEDSFQNGDDEFKVDDERYIDLRAKPMLQRRYDDKMKRRTVKRTVKKKKPAPGQPLFSFTFLTHFLKEA